MTTKKRHRPWYRYDKELGRSRKLTEVEIKEKHAEIFGKRKKKTLTKGKLKVSFVEPRPATDRSIAEHYRSLGDERGARTLSDWRN